LFSRFANREAVAACSPTRERGVNLNQISSRECGGRSYLNFMSSFMFSAAMMTAELEFSVKKSCGKGILILYF
jgi:hypothetical protein